jgi:carbohydrate kinase (thermoresistant glucokinase family)
MAHTGTPGGGDGGQRLRQIDRRQHAGKRLKAEFLEGDELHPPRNVERMTAGIALTDSDRRDWLLAIAQQLADAHAAGHDLVVSCSALKLA